MDRSSLLTIGIFSTTKTEKYRRQIIGVRNTWVKTAEENNINTLFFGGYYDHPEVKIINLPGTNEDYESVTNKQYKMLYYMWKNSPSEFYYIAGGDIYIVVHKVIELLNTLEKNDEYYIGKGDYREYKDGSIFFIVGGGGAIISHKVLVKLVTMLKIDLEYENEKLSFYDEWVKICVGYEYLNYASDVSLGYYAEKFCQDLKIIDNKNFLAENHFSSYYYEKYRVNNFVKWEDIYACHFMEPGVCDHFHNYLTIKDTDITCWTFITALKNDTDMEKTNFVTSINVHLVIYYKKGSENNAKIIYSHRQNIGLEHKTEIVLCDKVDNSFNLIKNILSNESTHYAWINIDIEIFAKNDFGQIYNIMKIMRDKCSFCYREYNDINCDFFTASKENMSKLLEIMKTTTLISSIYNEHPEIFDLYYGNNENILCNYDRIRMGSNYIVDNILRNLIAQSQHQLSYDICLKMLKDIKDNYSTLPILEHINLLDYYFISSFYLSKIKDCWNMFTLLDEIREDNILLFSQTFNIKHFVDNTDHLLNKEPLSNKVVIYTKGNFEHDKSGDKIINHPLILNLVEKYKVFIFTDTELDYYSMIHKNPIIRPRSYGDNIFQDYCFKIKLYL